MRQVSEKTLKSYVDTVDLDDICHLINTGAYITRSHNRQNMAESSGSGPSRTPIITRDRVAKKTKERPIQKVNREYYQSEIFDAIKKSLEPLISDDDHYMRNCNHIEQAMQSCSDEIISDKGVLMLIASVTHSVKTLILESRLISDLELQKVDNENMRLQISALEGCTKAMITSFQSLQDQIKVVKVEDQERRENLKRPAPPEECSYEDKVCQEFLEFLEERGVSCSLKLVKQELLTGGIDLTDATEHDRKKAYKYLMRKNHPAAAR